MRTQSILLTTIAVSATMANAAPAKTNLKSYLSGHTLIIKTRDDVPTVKLRRDGTYDYESESSASPAEADGPLDGKWYIKGRTVCLDMNGAQVADIPDSCYPVEIKPVGQSWTGRPTISGYPTKELWQFSLWGAAR